MFICIYIYFFQDVVYALAHATGKTGRFTLIERWRNNERLLAPQEHPLKVMAKTIGFGSESFDDRKGMIPGSNELFYIKVLSSEK